MILTDGSEISLAQTLGLCEGCISLSKTERLLPAEKQFHIPIIVLSLVSAHKGKKKGKYIGIEHKTGEKP